MLFTWSLVFLIVGTGLTFWRTIDRCLVVSLEFGYLSPFALLWQLLLAMIGWSWQLLRRVLTGDARHRESRRENRTE
ncbi:MAG: hypothetical protein JSS27_18595 [Planctomycetes bacterium]|nr:hypothetical protein [Planctomycetota bacterium]